MHDCPFTKEILTPKERGEGHRISSTLTLLLDSINLTMVLLVIRAREPTISSSESLSADEETVTAPQVVIPKKRLPDILVVHDIETLIPFSIEKLKTAEPSLGKFLACNSIKYVRKYPVRIPMTLIKCELYSSSHLRSAFFARGHCSLRHVENLGYFGPPHSRPALYQGNESFRLR